MPAELIYDLAGATKAGIAEQIAEAENYVPGLVFSYPPIPLWQAPAVPPTADELWQGSDVFSFNLYIHIPFCRQKCSFCYYSVAVVADDTEIIWDYLRCLEREARSYRSAVAGKRVETVFIGGGTPSRLTEDQIDFLFDRVIGQFDLSECREITYECSPDSATVGRIKAMARNGTNRLSMGVQSLDPEILHKSRRGDSPDGVIATYYSMADSGVPNINIDLIAGIERESGENIERTMNAVAALDPPPTQITLFTLSVREGAINKKTLAIERPVDLFEQSLARYRYAKKRMLDLGYWQYSRNLFPRQDYLFHYQDNHWGRNGYVLALGASGYSHSHGYTYLNTFNYRQYMKKIEAGESAVERLFPLGPEESLRRHLVLAMKHTELDLATFSSFYQADANPLAQFDPIFGVLAELGVVTRNDRTIRYTYDYRDLTDRFVRLFYSEEVNRRLREGPPREPARRDAFGFTV